MNIKIILLLLLLTCSCKRDDILPDATQDGRNTLGMLIDGKIWTAYFPGIQLEASDLIVNYYSNRQLLLITAVNSSKNNQEQRFYAYAQKIKSTGNFNFSCRQDFVYTECKDCNYCVDSTRFENGGDCVGSFMLVDSTLSNLNITRIDTMKRIISGKFSLKLKNRTGNQINITEGRFDATY